MTVPLCKTCIHYVPPANGRFDSEYSMCKKVSSLNVLNGEVEYSFASHVRTHACRDAVLYEPEPNVELKEYKHTLQRYAIYIGYVGIYLSLFLYAKLNRLHFPK